MIRISLPSELLRIIGLYLVKSGGSTAVICPRDWNIVPWNTGTNVSIGRARAAGSSALTRADVAIDDLHKNHGDDADSREDDARVADQRWDAIDVLATKPARSPQGLVAKAEAVSTRRLFDDFACHQRVATSLAEDVLRYFGARVAQTIKARGRLRLAGSAHLANPPPHQ
jgi:hypothetical protein